MHLWKEVMTDTEINEAIARECGWKQEHPPLQVSFGAVPTGWPESKVWWYHHQLPNYCHSLDQMHEAEKTLSISETEHFMETILDVINIPRTCYGTARAAFLTCHATARQRAEAFLRTKGLWK